MKSFADCMIEYRKQMERGYVSAAYKGLMEYISGLRAHFAGKHPDCGVSGSLYCGYMDMTYFALFPESLKRRKLKVAVVFLHDTFRFEAWLAGGNKQIQAKYWRLFKTSTWKDYRVPATTKGADSIIEHVLVAKPDFRNLDALTAQIEKGTLKFIREMEQFLVGN